MLDPKSNLLVHKEYVPADDKCFIDTRDQRTQRGTRDTHLRQAKVTKDQAVVRAEVHKEGSHGNKERKLYLAHASKHERASQRQTQEEKRNDGILQISNAVHDHVELFALFHEHLHDHVRDEIGQRRKDRSKADRQSHHNANGLSKGRHCLLRLLVTHTPVARNQHGRPHAKAHTKDVINADELVRKGHGGKLRLAELSHHDIIEHVHADGDQALRGDRQRQDQHALIKALLHVK